MASLTDGQMDRRNKKRRRESVERAVNFFNTNVPHTSGDQKRFALQNIRASGRPLLIAKALAKKFKSIPLPVDQQACPDLSAAQEARVTLLRRQPPALRYQAAYEDDLDALERNLAAGKISQQRFNKRCRDIAEKKLPDWMA